LLQACEAYGQVKQSYRGTLLKSVQNTAHQDSMQVNREVENLLEAEGFKTPKQGMLHCDRGKCEKLGIELRHA